MNECCSAELKRLIDLQAADERKVATLEHSLSNRQPKWSSLQSRIEVLCTQYAQLHSSYGRAMNPTFWSQCSARLITQISDLIDLRDAIQAGIDDEIRAAKDRLRQRSAMVIRAFASWCELQAAAVKKTDPVLSVRLHELREKARENHGPCGDRPS